mgnify:CR=1 FL=1
MHHRHIFSFTLTFTILASGCGSDHKSDDATTHDGTHSGGDSSSGEDTAVTTSGDATSDATGSTTATVAPPAAPTDLVASILEGGVHVTWKDAADNEDNFVLENKADGEADFSVVIELPFDSVTYHDVNVVSGTGYTYRVKAVNAGGESVSNEVMIQVP